MDRKDNKKEEQFINVQQYEKQYSEEKFWKKVKDVAKKAGIKIIYAALRLYYSVAALPIEKKAIVFGGLGYFIFPIDLIPDTIPALGFTDDAAILFAIYSTIKSELNEESDIQAKEKLKEWFEDYDEEDITIS
jgi:uncharacterized membrane protein YkvA (DUF1232 family)